MGCAPVLSLANGRVGARVMFVGEAPGRLGAAKTGVPFSGDMAGQRFERLLAASELRREHVFATNAVLCLPLDDEGRNRTPKTREVRACTGWLRETIDAVEPDIVVAMGRVALNALHLVAPHNVSLSDAGSTPVAWNGRELAAVYHPGARSQMHRPWEFQIEDWRRLGRWVRTAQNFRP